jgi:hypothetical protein
MGHDPVGSDRLLIKPASGDQVDAGTCGRQLVTKAAVPGA